MVLANRFRLFSTAKYTSFRPLSLHCWNWNLLLRVGLFGSSFYNTFLDYTTNVKRSTIPISTNTTPEWRRQCCVSWFFILVFSSFVKSRTNEKRNVSDFFWLDFWRGISLYSITILYSPFFSLYSLAEDPIESEEPLNSTTVSHDPPPTNSFAVRDPIFLTPSMQSLIHQKLPYFQSVHQILQSDQCLISMIYSLFFMK